MDLFSFISHIHASPLMAVIVVAGGGAQAVADLLAVPGASKTVLEALVPYSERSLIEFLGETPTQAVSIETAAAMARAAYRRALRLRNDPLAPVLGIACTATLVTDRPKKGQHRAHVGLCTEKATHVYSLLLKKGARERTREERIVSDLLLKVLAEACRVPAAVELNLLSHERLEAQEMHTAMNKGDNT